MTPYKAVTVAELIEILSKVEDKTATVEMEGCDCIGSASGKYKAEKGTDPRNNKPYNHIILLRGDELGADLA